MSKIILFALILSILVVGLVGIFYGNPIDIAYNLLTAQAMPSGNFTATFDGQIGQIVGGSVYATKLLNPRPMTADEASQLKFQISKLINTNAPVVMGGVISDGKLGETYTIPLNDPKNYYEQYVINFTTIPTGIDHCWINNFRVTTSSNLNYTISCVDKYIYSDTGSPVDYVSPSDNSVNTQKTSIASLSYQSLPLDLSGTKEDILSVKSLSLGTKKYLIALTSAPALYVFDASNPYGLKLLKKNLIQNDAGSLIVADGYSNILTIPSYPNKPIPTFYSLNSLGVTTPVSNNKSNPNMSYVFVGGGNNAYGISVNHSSTSTIGFDLYGINNPNSINKIGSVSIHGGCYGFNSRSVYLGVNGGFAQPDKCSGFSIDSNWSSFIISDKQYIAVSASENFHALRNGNGNDLVVIDVMDPKNPQRVFIKDDESFLLGSESKILGLNGIFTHPQENIIIDPINKKIISLYQTVSSELVPPNASYSLDMANKMTSTGLLDVGVGVFSFDDNFVKPVLQSNELAPYQANPVLTEIGNSLICEQRGMGLGGFVDAHCGSNSAYRGINSNIRAFSNGLAYQNTYALDNYGPNFKEDRLSFTGNGQSFSWISDPNNQMTEYKNHLRSSAYLSSGSVPENAILIQTDSKNFAVIKYDSKHIDVIKASFAVEIPMGSVGTNTNQNQSVSNSTGNPTVPANQMFSFSSLLNIFKRIIGR